MKTLYTALLLILFFTSKAHNSSLKLVEVNKQWAEHLNVMPELNAEQNTFTENDWIRLHLMLVEKNLRISNTTHLSASQKTNRQNCLSYLHEYWQNGVFPKNENYTYRTPIFIDNHNTFCAVGYLLKTSGNEKIARRISRITNLAYVQQMNYPELRLWAEENGFSIDELAWIQPGYAPENIFAPLGGGFDAPVVSLSIDTHNRQLYAVGPFYLCDYNIQASSIAVMNIDTKVWGNLGYGINLWSSLAKINCVTAYNGKVFVGGLDLSSFRVNGDYSVLYWDLDSLKWFGLPGIVGEVKNFYVWKDTLYACGNFIGNSNNSFQNVAKLSGNTWVNPGFKVNGHVNVLKEHEGKLVGAGKFDTVSQHQVSNIFMYDKDSISNLAHGIKNEVYDVASVSGKIIAAGEILTPFATGGFEIYKDTAWEQLFNASGAPPDVDGETKFNSIEALGDTVVLGGDIGSSQSNPDNRASAFTIRNGHLSYSITSFGYLDNGIKTMKYFDGKLYIGGDFIRETYKSNYFLNLNSIGYYDFENFTSVTDINQPELAFTFYPNPTTSNTHINIKNGFRASLFELYDIAGKSVAAGNLVQSENTAIQLPELDPGIYCLRIKNSQGEGATRKIVIQ
ncbi:MAG: T9SS type A sorting domain-containing protein [Chitinophagales bacterium]|nr:T9SS type A sorting domain-containing protein [Chitinophagales bacterium]